MPPGNNLEVAMSPSALRRSLIAAGALAALALPAAAHHGWTGYDQKDFALTGVVQTASLDWPHGLLKVKAADGGVWDVVLAPPNAIANAGLTMAAVLAGTKVTARGHRHLDPARKEIKTERLVVGTKTYDLYPNRS
ncbi:MAG: DUF6152 family protein [Phenylobacterium sp.]